MPSKVPYKKGLDITTNTTTQESAEQGYADIHPKRKSKPRDNWSRQENRFKERITKYMQDKTVGTHKFDNQKDAQKFIKNSINNQGAFIPTALQMIQNLKKVGNGQNPNSIKAVGAGNFAQAQKDIAKHFSSQNQQPANPCSLLDSNPQGVSPEQIEICCRLENRRNLTQKGREYCEYLDSLKELATEDSEFEVSEKIEDVDTEIV